MEKKQNSLSRACPEDFSERDQIAYWYSGLMLSHESCEDSSSIPGQDSDRDYLKRLMRKAFDAADEFMLAKEKAHIRDQMRRNRPHPEDL